MKVALLAGGVGSRLSEETVMKPKPMVEIGGRPILWHIMMHYHTYGYRDFVIAMNKHFQLKIPNRRINTTTERSSKIDISRAIRRDIEQWVYLDIDLYEYARDQAKPKY